MYIAEALSLHRMSDFRGNLLRLSVAPFPFDDLKELIQKPRIDLGSFEDLVHGQARLERALELKRPMRGGSAECREQRITVFCF